MQISIRRRTFCSVSFMNGRNGESHMTVGIFRFLHSTRTFARPSVVQTAGSMPRQRFLSAVVSVIWATAFDFALISSIIFILMSRRIRSLFVCTVTPNPRLLIISRQRVHKTKLSLAVHVWVAHRAFFHNHFFNLKIFLKNRLRAQVNPCRQNLVFKQFRAAQVKLWIFHKLRVHRLFAVRAQNQSFPSYSTIN